MDRSAFSISWKIADFKWSFPELMAEVVQPVKSVITANHSEPLSPGWQYGNESTDLY
jgi:hypothetical protein